MLTKIVKSGAITHLIKDGNNQVVVVKGNSNQVTANQDDDREKTKEKERSDAILRGDK